MSPKESKQPTPNVEPPRRERTEPNRNDPLGEPSIQRRIWAAYLAAGFNRSTWARAVETTYAHVDSIDTEKVMPRLATLLKMASLLPDYSLDELVYGRDARSRRRLTELSNEDVKLVLAELGADVETAKALGADLMDPNNRFVHVTRDYVCAFVADRKAKPELTGRAAIASAKRAGENARALAEAVADGVHPVSRAELAALREPQSSNTAPRKRRKA